MQDVHWALDELARRAGEQLPVALVGHSLGGRAALLSADRSEVRSVVGLAPWVYPADGQVDASGTRVLIVHGTADRIASPDRSWQAAQRLRRTARSLAYVRVDGAKHAMLARHGEFSGLAADFVAATVLDPSTPSRRVASLVDGAEDAILV